MRLGSYKYNLEAEKECTGQSCSNLITTARRAGLAGRGGQGGYLPPLPVCRVEVALGGPTVDDSQARIRCRSRIYVYVLTNPTFSICSDACLRVIHVWCDFYLLLGVLLCVYVTACHETTLCS